MKNLVFCFLAVLALSVLLADEFPIATGAYSQTYPEISFANGNYYTVYLDKQGGSYSYAFSGKFIAPDGTVAGETHQVVASYNAMSFMHDVAFGANSYLFGWSRQRSPYNYTRDAYGTIVDASGNGGAIFPISIGNSVSASFIKVAFDGTNYLVVWQEGMPTQGSSIRGQFVDASGNLVGSNFSIRPAGLATDVAQIYPDVTFDGTNYVVVWDDGRNGNRDIYGWFIAPDGSFIGDDFAICTNGADQLLVRCAFDGTHFLAVWADERDSSNDDGIYGQMFSTDGTMVGDNLAISITQNSEGRSWPDLGVNNGEYLVSWKQDFLEYDGLREIDETEVARCEAAGIPPTDPTVWYDVYGRTVAFDGSMNGDEFVICDTQYHQEEPAVASDGTDFLVAWQDSRNNNQYSVLYGMIVAGAVGPAPGFVEGTITLSGGSGDVTLVDVSAGTAVTNPDATGHYQLQVQPGTYTVTASLDAYETASVPDVVVAEGATVSNVDMTLSWIPPVLLPPENVVASIQAFNSVMLTWDAPVVPGATLSEFVVYRDYQAVATIPASQTSYSDDALDAGTYDYAVQAVYAEGSSDLSAPLTITVLLPEATDFVALDHVPYWETIMCQWQAPSTTRDILQYHVYRDGIEVGTSTVTAYIDSMTTFGEFEYWVVVEYDGGWMSEESNHYSVFFVEAGASPAPSVTRLMGNYPNPFNPVTTISFSLDAETPVTLQVYNLRGELVTTLVNSTLNAMTHRIQWDGTDSRGKAVSSGIYYYHLKAGSYTASRKMILLK